MKKKGTTGSKVIPIKKPEGEMSFAEQVEDFTKHHKVPDELSRIFTELGLSHVKDGCSGNCITCKKKAGCETYSKITGCFNNTRD